MWQWDIRRSERLVITLAHILKIQKGTEVPSLFRDKETTGQAQNLAMG